MVFKTLIIAILVYFAVRTVLNLLKAVRQDAAAPPPIQPPRPTAPPHRPELFRNPARSRRRDVEDAKWEDL